MWTIVNWIQIWFLAYQRFMTPSYAFHLVSVATYFLLGLEGVERVASSPMGIANFSTQVKGGEIHHVLYSVGDRVRVR